MSWTIETRRVEQDGQLVPWHRYSCSCTCKGEWRENDAMAAVDAAAHVLYGAVGAYQSAPRQDMPSQTVPGIAPD